MNIDWKRKLTSRKLWVAVAEFVTMLIVALGGAEEQATQIAALIMAGAGAVAYIIGEGLADANHAQTEYVVMTEDDVMEPAEFYNVVKEESGSENQ